MCRKEWCWADLYAIKMQQLGAQAALQHLSKQLQNAPIQRTDTAAIAVHN